MAGWVWLEAITWADARWQSGSITLGQLVVDLNYLLTEMRHAGAVTPAVLDRLQTDLDVIAVQPPSTRHGADRSVEVQQLLQRCSDLVHRTL